VTEGIEELVRRKLSRRGFLKAGAAGVSLAAGAPLLSACFGSAPGSSSGGKTLRLLLWAHFVPAYDKYFTAYCDAWGKKNNVTVIVDHVPTATVVIHFASEVAAGSGHDLVQLQEDSQIAVFKDHLLDLTDLANKIGSANGPWNKATNLFAIFDGKWLGLPEFYIQYPGLYRKDLFDANHLTDPPLTFQNLLDAGRVMKPKGNYIGIGFGSDPDSEIAAMMLLWNQGGASFVDKTGTKSTISSPETLDTLRFVKTLFDEALSPEVLSWNDFGNNQALDAGVASFILNPISAYRSASADLQSKIYVSPPPGGPGVANLGSYGEVPKAGAPLMGVNYQSWVMPKWSKQRDLAKQFLTDYFDQLPAAFQASTGYNFPVLQKFTQKPMPILGTDPKLNLLQDTNDNAVTNTWPAAASPALGAVFDNYVLSTMFNRACAGEAPEKSMAWADQQLKALLK